MLGLIIFGTRGVTYTKGKGEFSCPVCGGRQPYRHRRQRRFFTLYFIPVIPLDLLGEFVECGTCRNTFRLSILDYDPEAESRQIEAQWEIALRQAMVHMSLADGHVDESEMAAMANIFARVTGRPLARDELEKEIAEGRRQGSSGLLAQLRDLGGTLNDQGKERIIGAAVLVASADGDFDEDERQLLAALGHALAMSPAHIRGAVAATEESGL